MVILGVENRSVVSDLPDVFERSVRCILGFAGRRGPLVSPMAFWADGASLWMSTPAVSVKAAALRARPDCAVYVPPVGGVGEGAVARGRARVYGLHDPLGLAVHSAVVSTAMAALAARNAGTILGYVQDASAVPARFRPRNRVAVRISLSDVTPVPALEPAAGIAPSLPMVISPAVRRAVAGERQIALGLRHADGMVSVVPAVWGAGFALTLPPGMSAADGTPAVAHVGSDPHQRPTQVMGVSLIGAVDGGRLRPERATWWEGFRLTTVDVPQAPTSVVLPD